MAIFKAIGASRVAGLFTINKKTIKSGLMGFAGIVAIAGLSACQTAEYEMPAINDSLTGKAGNATQGRLVAIDRKLGNCLACHAISDIPEQQFHGEVGPSLDGVADRYTEGQIRQMVVNAKTYFPDTLMPAFYKTDGLNRVADKFEGKTILTAEQVEDVVAYVMTLRE